MAELGFYDANRYRFYPFLEPDAPLPDNRPNTLALLPTTTVADFGCWLGPTISYDVAAHDIYLSWISRKGRKFVFAFRSTAPDLAGHELRFYFSLDDVRYHADFREAVLTSAPIHPTTDSESLDSEAPGFFITWSGYKVIGDLDELATQLLPTNNQKFSHNQWFTVEPATITLLGRGLVTSLNIANEDRTRASAPEGCPPADSEVISEEESEIISSNDNPAVIIQAENLLGEVRFKPGYGVVLAVDPTGEVNFDGAPGAGAGFPCAEIPLFPGEVPPRGSSLLEGGPTCNEVLRRLNGHPGPQAVIGAGTGVSIVNSPDTNSITVDVDLHDLSTCGDE